MSNFNPSTPYAVLMTVYAADDPNEFGEALDSCLKQTYPPERLIVVADGPLTVQLDSILARYEHDHKIIESHRLPSNCGRGAAARMGIKKCKYNLVGIMSANDVSVPERFEKQVSYLENNPSVDVVGGYVAECTDKLEEVQNVRKVPTEPSDIASMARFRSPMNSVTVMYRREAVLSAGNYRPLDRMEDYDLWVRLLLDDATLTNIPEILAKVRAGEDMYRRRGGIEYAREEFRQQVSFWRMGFIGAHRALVNLSLRLPIRLVPNRLRSWVYQRFFREKA